MAVADLAVRGLAIGRSVIVLALPGDPVGVGIVAVEDNALQVPGVIRVVRVLAGQLELELPAAGDLHAFEAQLKALNVLRQLLLGKAVVGSRHIGQQEGGALHHSSALSIHV